MLPPDTPFPTPAPQPFGTDALGPYRRTVWFGRALAAGLGFLASAALFGLVFQDSLSLAAFQSGDPIAPWLGLGACLGATVAAPLYWSLMVPDGRSFRLWRGLLAGVLAVLAAHVTMALGAMLPFFWTIATEPHTLGDTIAAVGEAMAAAVAMAFFSLVVVGMVTVPLGAVAGTLVTWLCRRRLHRALRRP